LLRDEKTSWSCPTEDLPVTLLVDLFVVASVRKLVIQSDKHPPQQIRISYSLSGNKNSFKTLKIVNKELKKGVSYVIDLKTPIRAKYFRLRVTKGNTTSVSLSKIEIYGSPLVTPENLANIEYSKALNTIYEKAKNMV
jgi:hypothetical protein